MKHTTLILTGLSLTASALTLIAQDPTTGPLHAKGPRGPRAEMAGRPHLILRLDTNQDRALSPEELAGASAALLQLDANQDGTVSADELCPPGRGPQHRPGPGRSAGQGRGPGAAVAPVGDDEAAPAPATKRPTPPVIAAVDLNDDGILSPEEIAAAPQSLLRLDANQDGVLTREEVRPGDARGFGGPGPHGRGQGRGQGGPGFRGGFHSQDPATETPDAE